MDDKLKVFVSYARSDMAVADRLVAALEARDFDLLIDRRDLPYGEKWQSELIGFISRADAIVFIVSPRSIRSDWCRWEIDQVTAQSKRLVPIEIEPVPRESLPTAVGDIHLLPFTINLHFERQAEILAAVLGTDAQWLKQHTRLRFLADEWLTADRAPSLRLTGPRLGEALEWIAHPPSGGPPVPEPVREFIEESRRSERYDSPWYFARSDTGTHYAMDYTVCCKRCGYTAEFTPALGERPAASCPRCGLD